MCLVLLGGVWEPIVKWRTHMFTIFTPFFTLSVFGGGKSGPASVRVVSPTLSRFSGVMSTATPLVSIETPTSTLDTGPRNLLSVFGPEVVPQAFVGKQSASSRAVTAEGLAGSLQAGSVPKLVLGSQVWPATPGGGDSPVMRKQ